MTKQNIQNINIETKDLRIRAIRSLHHNKYLNLHPVMLQNNGVPDVWERINDLNRQWWRIEKRVEGREIYSIHSYKNENYLLANYKSENYNGGQPKITNDHSSDVNKILWIIKPSSVENHQMICKIISFQYKKCLNLRAEDAYNGGKPTLYDSEDHPDQYWVLQGL